MDPITSATLITNVIPTLRVLLPKHARVPIATAAVAIMNAADEAQEPKKDRESRVRDLFRSTRDRLAVTWKLGLTMTIILFALFVAMAVVSVVTGLLGETPTYSIVFGGVSVTSLFTVIIWKPYDRAFKATVVVQQLEIILTGLEEQWNACRSLRDDPDQVRCLREASEFALKELAKIGGG